MIKLNLLAENMRRFGTKNLSKYDHRRLQRLTEAGEPTYITFDGQKEAGNYFNGLLKTRQLTTNDMYLSGTGCYRISGWNSAVRVYTVAFWGIVMKQHPNFPVSPTLPNPPTFFTAQYIDGSFTGNNGTEPGSTAQDVSGDVRFETANQYTEGGWSSTAKMWTKVIKVSDPETGKLVSPVLSWGPSQATWYGPGPDNFLSMVKALPTKQKLLTNFCTDKSATYLAVVPQAQKELYTCPTKKP
jgi:hypothetical protein